ncbi:MAG TPA: MBL fold metallo-hydrolase [Candidatus Paceibacterota bacterium]|nr:MBL fold metallo-hydrolase [Candidatus Paceibacterota bacterium]
MVITSLGNGAFRLQSGETSLLLNPEGNRFKADVVLKTLSPAEFALYGDGAPEQNEIFFPGEYEIKGIEVTGIPVPDESTSAFLKTVYAVEWEGVKLAFLGHLTKPATASIIEALGEPDILFIPAGGGHFLEPEVAAKLAKQIEPAYIIPTLYKSPAEFLKAMGQKAEPQEKLVFKKKDLESEKNKVVVLSNL